MDEIEASETKVRETKKAVFINESEDCKLAVGLEKMEWVREKMLKRFTSSSPEGSAVLPTSFSGQFILCLSRILNSHFFSYHTILPNPHPLRAPPF